mgnify:FL=1
MPVILPSLPDPTELVLQGEQMRVSVIEAPVSAGAFLWGGQAVDAGFSSLVRDEDAFMPMNSLVEGNWLSIRRQKNGVLQVRANGGIATPCGAWLPIDYSPLIRNMMQASVRWGISGVTKDSAGAALGDCRVVALETGRMAKDGGFGTVGPESPVVGETISDVSGNYTIEVALNTAHQLTGYKPGSPDVAGVTRNDVTPVAIG